jgi:hypothetical protein
LLGVEVAVEEVAADDHEIDPMFLCQAQDLHQGGPAVVVGVLQMDICGM